MPDAASPIPVSQSGFVVLPGAFAGDDLADLRDAADRALGRMLCAASTADAEQTTTVWPDGHRLQELEGTTIHWEPDAPDGAVRSLSPVTQLDPRLDALWTDPRLTGPMCELLEASEAAPRTSGLNFKKAGVGSEFRWHQDTQDTDDLARPWATAMIFLDDARVDNGPLCVLPGSHLSGLMPLDPADPIGELADASLIVDSDAVTIIVEAGSVVMFSALLLHRSSTNRSTADRRALRLCFQAASGPGPALTRAARRRGVPLVELP